MASSHTLLVTGAAGAIGQRLLTDLAAHPDVERMHLLAHRLPVVESPPRVVVARGDITAGADLGLSPAAAAAVKRSVTGIIHLAADTRFDAPLETLRGTNVEGLANVLTFARECRSLDRVLIASTTHVAGRRTGVILEDDLEHDAGFVNAYETSKHEAEVVVRARRDVPVSVCRLSTVVGDSRTGDIARRGAIHHAVLSFLAGLAPMLPGCATSPVDLLALDDASRALAALATSAFEPGETWHLCAADDTISAGDLVDLTMQTIAVHRPSWRRRALERPVFVDLATFELFRRSVDEVGDSAMRAATGIVSQFAPQLAYPKQFDDRRCRARLASSGLTRAPIGQVWPAVVARLVRSRNEAG